ncbi:MAG: transposase [Chloroflexota bacterium]
MCAPNDQLSRIDAGLWQQLLQHAEVQSLWEVTQPFLAMVRQRQPEQFSPWLTNCLTSTIPELRNFARGLQRDAATVMAALAVPWSNGPVEGHIHQAKLIKRSMYGRANFDLLRQRVLYVK